VGRGGGGKWHRCIQSQWRVGGVDEENDIGTSLMKLLKENLSINLEINTKLITLSSYRCSCCVEKITETLYTGNHSVLQK
jgi:hypothetical protein